MDITALSMYLNQMKYIKYLVYMYSKWLWITMKGQSVDLTRMYLKYNRNF